MRYYRLRNTVNGRESVDVTWVMGRKNGFFLARWEAIDVDEEFLDHAILVSATSWLLLDPVEKLVMEMKEGVLEACVGNDFSVTAVLEMK